jgi:F-type H+-transporting ATPase subunit gamma
MNQVIAEIAGRIKCNKVGGIENRCFIDSQDPKVVDIVFVTADKGLCGGVNSIIGRMTKTALAKLDASGKEYQIFMQGEKGSSQFRRAYGDKFFAQVTEREAPYNFDLASSITSEILSAECDQIHILYNKFKSAIAYIPTIKSITPLVDPNDPSLYQYEISEEDDLEILQNFYEYTLATEVFYAMLQNATSEQSSRMSAMENASKNAAEMVDKLTLQYNRARQARITTELIEIISGASALEG